MKMSTETFFKVLEDQSLRQTVSIVKKIFFGRGETSTEIWKIKVCEKSNPSKKTVSRIMVFGNAP